MTKYLLGLCGILIVSVYFLAYDAGKKSVAIQAGKEIAASLKIRGNEDEKAANMRGYDVCVAISRVPDDCSELRGIQSKP